MPTAKAPAAPTRVPGLTYVTDEGPGITRAGAPGAFVYAWRGRRVTHRATLDRIRALAIPPAWARVWIAPRADGHIQATGRDARQRKQYRYHPQWRANRDAAKFDHLLEFARVLPAIRAAVRRDLARSPASRAHVLAVVVALLERTHMRVGNDAYARANDSFGLTTLRNGHARVRGTRVEFRFTGKAGVRQHVRLDDPRLARDVRRCQDLPGQTLFEYLAPHGRPRAIGSADVNRYLAEISGVAVTAKVFRTWWATVSAASRLRAETPATEADARRTTLDVIDHLAAELGNTRAVCRACYIHPALLARFGPGGFEAPATAPTRRGLDRDEAWVVSFLRRVARQPPIPRAA